MPGIDLVDLDTHVLDIHRDLSVAARARQPGPPERIDGMSVGVVMVEGNGPHGGEMHPDGDEILYVISGELTLHCDSMDAPLKLPPGGACVVRQGEWHNVTAEVPTQIVHITPGPNGDARPKQALNDGTE